MSDGKSTSYQVVSVEELRRRELAAAQDRLRRAREALGVLRAATFAATETYGKMPVKLPADPTASSDEPGTVRSMAEQLEAATADARHTFEVAVAEARTRHLTSLAENALRRLGEGVELAPLASRPTSQTAPAVDLAAEAIRIVERLPGDADDAAVARCRRIIDELVSAPAERAITALAALRSVVQDERISSLQRSDTRVEVDAQLKKLDGISAEEAGQLRGELRALPLDRPLSDDLKHRVQMTVESARRVADRRFVLSSVRSALLAEGYEIGEDFMTLVGSTDGALVPLNGFDRHWMCVRDRQGALTFHLVRFDPTGPDHNEDLEAGTAFCSSFSRLLDTTVEQGAQLKVEHELEAGSGRMEWRDAQSPPRAARRSKSGRTRRHS